MEGTSVQEVGKILPLIFKKQIQRVDPKLVEILTSLWPRVAGKLLAQQCRPIAFQAGTLTLATPCESWAAQLPQMAEEIRAEINSFMGCPIVRKLRVQHVEKLDPAEFPGRHPERPSPPETTRLHCLDGEAKIDGEMARILETSFTKYFARKRKGEH